MKSASGLIFFLLIASLLMYVPINTGNEGLWDMFNNSLGMREFDTVDRLVFLIGSALYCIIFAYLADIFLTKLAFGPLFNGIAAFLAICVAMHYYSKGHGNFSSRDAGVFLQLLTLPTFAALGLGAIVRKIMSMTVGTVMASGRTHMEIPDSKKLSAIAPTDDRMRAATRAKR